MPNIQTDTLTRRLYANDASIYEQLPQGVCFPESVDDISELVLQAAQSGFSITARSAGTSLVGQTTGGGVIMDVSRYMNRVLNIDPEARTARVQPGVIRDLLNRETADHGLLFGPDTSTTNRCMIGGMMGNNSAGSYSIKYKTTREHVMEVEAVLSDGSIVTFKKLTASELEEKCRQEDLEGSIYRQMLDLLREHKELIEHNYPHPEIIRRNTGYALDKLCEMDPITPGGRPFNMSELLCGSEGTLAMTGEATLNLVPRPEHENLLIVQFADLIEAMEATVEAVEMSPSAVELVDDVILGATESNLEQRKNRFFLEGEPKCILLIQFQGRNLEVLNKKARKLRDRLKEKGLGYSHTVIDEKEQMERVWELRRAGLGLLMGIPGDARSPTFIEDIAVRVKDLPDYMREFQQILKKYETESVYYAHASVGLVHIRPILDISIEGHLDKMRGIMDDAAELVRKYRGSYSGEHGDGRIRSPYIEKTLGKEMMPVLRQVKTIWDPENRFNPGKIIDPEPIDKDLRYQPGYKPVDLPTVFNWRNEQGFGRALEQCNGAGVCRKRPESGGTMCPSYHATLEEKDTTRGRANLFRQIFNSQGSSGFTSSEIREGLELCLGCKACKSECPANVDMARMKAEFLNGWYKKKGTPLSVRFFGQPEKFYPFASALAPLTNILMSSRLTGGLMKKMLRVDPRRNLPKFADRTFRSWFDASRSKYQKGDRPKAALLVDLFTDYHEPEIARSACKVLDHLGYDIVIPEVKATGRPQISLGLLDKAKKICRTNLKELGKLAEDEIPVVGLEPSELLTLRDEYPDLCDEKLLNTAEKVSGNSFLWEEFLLRHFDANPDDTDRIHGEGVPVAMHGHCHTKALVGNEPLEEVLRRCGFNVEVLQTGCCGMAGSFGYDRDHYDVSMKIAKLQLFPGIQNLNVETEVIVSGFSCRHQIADGLGDIALHPAQLMELRLPPV